MEDDWIRPPRLRELLLAVKPLRPPNRPTDLAGIPVPRTGQQEAQDQVFYKISSRDVDVRRQDEGGSTGSTAEACATRNDEPVMWTTTLTMVPGGITVQCPRLASMLVHV